MNKRKYEKCSFPNCNEPHRRNSYCANHSQKFKRGTLFLEKKQRLYSILCPNHHKLADIGKITQQELQTVTNIKITSILEELKGVHYVSLVN